MLGYSIPNRLTNSYIICVGFGNTNRCIKTSAGAFIRNRIDVNESSNAIVIGRAHWQCDDYCYGCKFRLSNVGLSNCHDYRRDIKVIFTQTINEIKSDENVSSISNKSTIYMSIGLSALVTVIMVIALALAYKKNKTRMQEKNFTLTKPTMSDVHGSMIKYKYKIYNFVI